jgi:hypothetical protein
MADEQQILFKQNHSGLHGVPREVSQAPLTDHPNKCLLSSGLRFLPEDDTHTNRGELSMTKSGEDRKCMRMGVGTVIVRPAHLYSAPDSQYLKPANQFRSYAAFYTLQTHH